GACRTAVMAEKTSLRSQEPGGSKHNSTSRHRPGGPGIPPGRPGGPAPLRIGPLSWLILALLIVWNAWAFMPHRNVEVSLPYSAFVNQVASGNVTAVTIVGASVTGRFAHPLTWPPP